MIKALFVAVVAAISIGCQDGLIGPSGGPGLPPPPPPIPPSGPFRLNDAEGKELPMTVRLITARYVSRGFQFAIEVCVDPYQFTAADHPKYFQLNYGMMVRFIPSRDGVNPSYSGMGGTRVANPWPNSESKCVTYDASNSVTQISHDDVKFVINWAFYGYDWVGREYPNVPPGDPPGGVHVFDVRPPS